MELQCAPPVARKLLKILKLAFFMMKNGLVSKRKLMLDINLLMKRGKLLSKSLGTLMFHHHHHHHDNLQQASSSSAATPDEYVYGPDEYEFSCSNTPNPVIFPVNSKRKHSYFPCIGAPPVDDQDMKSVQFTYKLSDIAHGDKRTTPVPSPFSVRISNFSMAEDGSTDGLSCEVDNKAEEFIKRFYQQLHAQGHINATPEH